MKKKLAYLLLIISTILLVLYFIRYKRALILEHKIPITATEVVQINLRQIEHHLLFDAIKNPFKYLSFKSTKKGSHTSFKETIDIPKNILFYTNTSNFKGAWFSNVITLKDSAKLRDYLLQEAFKASTHKNVLLFTKGKINIAVFGNKAVIIYKQQGHITIDTAIKTIFKETEFYTKENSLLQAISNSKSDFTYANLATDFLEADFKNGLLEIKGNIASNLFLTDTYFENSENSIGFIATKINKNHPIFKSFTSGKNNTKFNNFTKLSLDSIVDKWSGSVLIDLKTINSQTDTIVTYDYDDDFNKVEKKSVQELIIPNINILLGNTTDLYAYLYRNNAVQIVETDTLFTSIPFYKMYTEKQNNSVNIFTKKPTDTGLLKEKKYKFSGSFSISKYVEKPLAFSSIPIKKDYLQLLNNASATLTSTNELLIQVSLKDNSRNFIGQIIKP